MDNDNKKMIDKFKERDAYPDRQVESGFVNPETGSSVMIDKEGNIIVASSENVQYKMNYASGAVNEISFQSDTTTNRKRLFTDEVLINNHKLNPQIYELTDMKSLFGDPNYCLGNLTMNATVLVKSWEPNLKKWVLIRRPIRTPLFMNSLGIAGAPKEMKVDDNITKEIKDIEEESKK